MCALKSLDLFMLFARELECHIVLDMIFCSHKHFLVVLIQGVISYHIIESDRGEQQENVGRYIGCWKMKSMAHLSRRYL